MVMGKLGGAWVSAWVGAWHGAWLYGGGGVVISSEYNSDSMKPSKLNNLLNIVLCPIKVNSNKIELTVHSSCYCVLNLLCVIALSITDI